MSLYRGSRYRDGRAPQTGLKQEPGPASQLSRSRRRVALRARARALQPPRHAASAAALGTAAWTPLLLEIFRNESPSHIEQITPFSPMCEALPRPHSATLCTRPALSLQRQLRTWRDSAIAILATRWSASPRTSKANSDFREQADLVELLARGCRAVSGRVSGN